MKPLTQRIDAVLNKRPSSPTPRPKWQSTETKVGILRSACLDQAIQSDRAGFAEDGEEWRRFADLIEGLR